MDVYYTLTYEIDHSNGLLSKNVADNTFVYFEKLGTVYRAIVLFCMVCTKLNIKGLSTNITVIRDVILVTRQRY